MRGREHLLRIGEPAGRGDDVRRRHGEGDVEAAVLEIELAGADIRLVIPPFHVIVDGEARVPLRDLVEWSVVAHASGALRRHAEVPGKVEIDRGPRREWREQIDAHRRAVDRPPRAPSGDARRIEHEPAGEALTGEVEGGAEEGERRLVEQISNTGRRADVLLEVQPEIRQRVGAVVRVVDRLASAQLVARWIERRRDAIVGALLPVARAGPTGPAPVLVRCGQRQRPERRAVGYAGGKPRRLPRYSVRVCRAEPSERREGNERRAHGESGGGGERGEGHARMRGG